ncbi:ABC transporter ATP-binding protein [Legionella sp. W05-934-2]|uniref:ABC transporter ATP-binding protein n=1 Tax=Legionella sp. W05-934-2 TaxID=1198649 RepID=UPI0034626829
MNNTPIKLFLKQECHQLKLKIFVFFVMSLIIGVLEVLGIALIFPFIYVLISPESINKFRILKYLAKTFQLNDPHTLNIVLLATISILIILKAGYTVFFRYLQFRVLTNFKTNLSRRLMKMYLFSDYALHMKKSSAEIMKNIALAPLIYDQYIMSYFNLIVSSIICLGLCALLFFVLPMSAIQALIIMVLAVYGINKGMKKYFKKIGKEATELYKDRQKVITQSLGAFRDTKLLGRETYFENLYTKTERSNFINQHFYNFLASLPPVIMEAWIMCGVLAVILFNNYQTAYVNTLAIFGVLIAVMFRMLPQVNKIFISLQLIDSSQPILESIANEFYEHEKNIYIPDQSVKTAKLNLDTMITFRDVTYCYPKKNVPALSNINISIKKYEFIGLTGPSGSGKSTFMNLLLGLIDPSEGGIFIDEENIHNKRIKRMWQNNIGHVPQALYMTDDTIKNNIAFGIEDGEIDINRVDEVVKESLLNEFVNTLPKGIDEKTGETGSTLSGGQRQRIGIARALYHNPDVLAFDEVTNGLDANLEYQFIQALNNLKNKRTIFLISHKLDTLKLCDRILVFNRGSIIDDGPFEVIAERCDLFKGLIQSSKITKMPAEKQTELLS